MARRSDDALATLALTSRVVAADAPPLKASEFWRLAETVAPGTLLGRPAVDLATDLGEDLGARVAALLDRSAALAFALEELEQRGIVAITTYDDDYPPQWRERLGAGAPAAIHVAGPVSLLNFPAFGIVGSRDIDEDAVEVARRAAQVAADDGFVIVSGGARGSDQAAMEGAFAAQGGVVGILADAITNAARDASVRRAILDEQLCVVSPYAPDAPFSAAAALGRNKLIYALAERTFVVASARDSGGTWSGATEAMTKGYGDIAVWRGPGEGVGNAGLVAAGARAVTDLDELLA